MNQVLRDKSGRIIGAIEKSGTREMLRDASGRLLGEYDGKVTRDRSGRLVGNGNLLTMLLSK